MKKRPKRPIKARKRWVINPRVRITESGKLYKRARVRREVLNTHED
ncbi:MAG: hypothetical protein WC522_04320 [Candidatus Omnitrophota bacterium]